MDRVAVQVMVETLWDDALSQRSNLQGLIIALLDSFNTLEQGCQSRHGSARCLFAAGHEWTHMALRPVQWGDG